MADIFTWFLELPIHLKLILVFAAISAAPVIKGVYDWVRTKLIQRNLKKIKKEAELRTPKITINGLWGPYGHKEEKTSCFELKRNCVEFLTIQVHNKRDSGEVYLFKLNMSFPEGFELLMEGDAKLKRSKLGKTKEFIDDLVGEGNPPEYRSLPKFGGDLPEPKDIQHDRRVFRQRGTSGPSYPGMTFQIPFWVKTPSKEIKDGKIHVSVQTNLLIRGLDIGAWMKAVEDDIEIKIA